MTFAAAASSWRRTREQKGEEKPYSWRHRHTLILAVGTNRLVMGTAHKVNRLDSLSLLYSLWCTTTVYYHWANIQDFFFSLIFYDSDFFPGLNSKACNIPGCATSKKPSGQPPSPSTGGPDWCSGATAAAVGCSAVVNVGYFRSDQPREQRTDEKWKPQELLGLLHAHK